MIVLFTDFSLTDPYLGQVKSVLLQNTSNIDIVDLLHNAPDFNIKSSAYLLDAYSKTFPDDSVFLCVIDPGVGSKRKACAVKINNKWFVGPENGLFNVLLARSANYEYYHLNEIKDSDSCTFDGRDLFAPVAAKLAMKQRTDMTPFAPDSAELDDYKNDCPEIIYIDHYGNLITGFRFDSLADDCVISLDNKVIQKAGTFSEVAAGEPFYYKNANGLLEIAVNQGNACSYFNVAIGERIGISR